MRDPFGRQDLGETARREQPVLADHHHRGTGGERRQHLTRRQVEHRRAAVQHPVTGPAAPLVAHPVQVGDETPVRQLDTLRVTRRARGVQHVRQVVRAGGRLRGETGGGVQVAGVEQEGPPRALRHPGGVLGAGEHEPGGTVGQDPAQPVRRGGGVQRHVHPTGVPDRQRRQHLVDAPVQQARPGPAAPGRSARDRRAGRPPRRGCVRPAPGPAGGRWPGPRHVVRPRRGPGPARVRRGRASATATAS